MTISEWMTAMSHLMQLLRASKDAGDEVRGSIAIHWICYHVWHCMTRRQHQRFQSRSTDTVVPADH